MRMNSQKVHATLEVHVEGEVLVAIVVYVPGLVDGRGDEREVVAQEDELEGVQTNRGRQVEGEVIMAVDVDVLVHMDVNEGRGP